MSQSLRIGFIEDFHPFASGTSKHCTGMIIDMVEAVSAHVGFQMQWVPLKTGNIEEQLAEDSLDIIAGVAINAHRRKILRFSQPILQTGAAWFIPDASSTCHMPPKRVSTPGTGPLVAIISQKYPDIEVVETGNYSIALEAALSGAVDAAALNHHVGRYIADRDFPGRFILPEEPFHALPLAMAFNHTVPEALIREINESLEMLQNSGSVQSLAAPRVQT